MAANLTTQFQKLIDRDPQAQALIRAYQQAYAASGPAVRPTKAGATVASPITKAAHTNLSRYLYQTYGPQGWSEDYGIDPQTGQVKRAGFFGRNLDRIGPAAVGAFATAGSLGLLSGGGTASSVAGMEPAGSTWGLPGSVTGGGTAGNVAGGVGSALAGRGLKGLLSNPDFWGILAGFGTELYSAKKQSDAAEDANDLARESADRQAEALQKALDLQKEMYEKDRLLQQGLYSQNRSDLAPYRAAGQGSVGKLSYLLGVPGFESGPQAYQPLNEIDPFVLNPATTRPDTSLVSPTRASQQQAQQASPMAPTPQTPQPEAMVMLEAPDGTRKEFPASQAQYYIQRGAKRV